jgi:predicted transcriptional regulator
MYFIFVKYIYDMTTFTSTLPDDLLQKLAEKAQQLKVPKNKLMESALRLYLDHLTRAEYIRSYKQMNEDVDLMKVAEEGMDDYLRQLDAQA